MNKSIIIGIIVSSVLLPGTVFAAESKDLLDLTAHPVGYFSLLIFLLSYVVVMAEEFTDLRKSKPVILAAGIIWGMIGYIYTSRGIPEAAEIAFKHNLLVCRVVPVFTGSHDIRKRHERTTGFSGAALMAGSQRFQLPTIILDDGCPGFFPVTYY